MSNSENQGNFEKAGESIGEFVGKVAGQATDRAMEMTGAMFNSMASAMGSWWSGDDAQQAASSFTSREDDCREHFRSQSRNTGNRARYEDVRPVYQVGHVARHNPSYNGRSFSEVEPELQRSWESGPSRQYGAWPEVRDYVGYAYDGGTAGSSGNAAGSSQKSSGNTEGRTSMAGEANIGGAHVSGSIHLKGGAGGSGNAGTPGTSNIGQNPNRGPTLGGG